MKWTDEQISYLVDNYDKITNEEIGKYLGKSYDAICKKACKMKLKKPSHFFKIPSSGRFGDGHKPWNTGTKGVCKGSSTTFRQGNRPHNAYDDNGIIVLRKDSGGHLYKWYKIADANWVLYHRWVWEQRNGEIPEGYIVAFKDGDRNNCDINNLELITRKENRVRNSSSTLLKDNYIVNSILSTYYVKGNLPLKNILLENKDLIELKRNQIKLRRLCKEIQK